MPVVIRSTLLALICLTLIASDDAFAQLSIPGGGSAALRERGILGRLGSRLDARQNRLDRTAANKEREPAPGPAGGPQANTGQPEKAPELNRLPGQPTAPGQPPAGGPRVGGRDADPIRRAQYAVPGSENSPGGVQPAAATTPLPPNRLPYTGPGVSLRLPTDLAGEVNYLVDDAEHMVIGSGEEQHLRAKGGYEIRFSRGIDDSGRSYGEARYTITEGNYRFAVTDKGWELFREADAPRTALSPASETLRTLVPEPLGPSELSEIRHKPPIDTEPARSQEATAQVAPATSEVLPTPTPTPTLRSILERE